MITIYVIINSPMEKVWEYWTNPKHICKWNHASEDWHTPNAENDLRENGKFSYRMEAKNESFGFDFSGTYKKIQLHQKLSIVLDDHRSLDISFIQEGDSIKIIEEFEAENENPIEMQKMGWQMILDNFKKYIEAN